MKWQLAGFTGAFTLALQLHAPADVDACGVKLVHKNASPRKAKVDKRTPIRSETPPPVIAAKPARQPIAVGPSPGDRRVASKPVEPPPKPVEPPPKPVAPPPAVTTDPKPAPVEVKPEPKPIPKPVAPAPVQKRDEIYFGLNSSAATKVAIDRVARWLTANPSIQVTIEGHADPTGDPASNMKLSEQRAEAVRNQLVAAGIDASRLEVRPFGDTKLKYGPADGRNRRVAIEPKP